MIQRYFAKLSFKGTRYFGWQIQPGHITVQEVLETTFSTFFRQRVAMTGAGRTDTGVHASRYVAHFEAGNLPDELSDLVFKLNRFLPGDISIHSIIPVHPDAHARFSAISRTYQYFITRVKDPFCSDTAYLCLWPLDVESMNQAASLLLNNHDFTSFSKLHSDVKSNICKVEYARWEQADNKLVFTITADRFLRNMVRAVAGTLLEVGKGKLSVPDFEEIILKKNRNVAGTSAPALGLILTEVKYPEGIYLK